MIMKKIMEKFEKIAQNASLGEKHYYFILIETEKPLLLAFPLTLKSFPLIKLGGHRAIRLYNTALDVLKSNLNVDEIKFENTRIRMFHVSPDVGETVLVWIISQATAKIPDKGLLSALLRFGVPSSIRKIRDELYEKSKLYVSSQKDKLTPLISSRLINKVSKSLRQILDVLLP